MLKIFGKIHARYGIGSGSELESGSEKIGKVGSESEKSLWINNTVQKYP
jgi:hypothetical protein